MEHPRSKLPAVLVVLFCIALLAGVGVLLWKTLPEKQEPAQAEAIQTDGVFSSEPTTVEPEREEPYEGDLPGQAEAAQPENPDEQPQENPEDQNLKIDFTQENLEEIKKQANDANDALQMTMHGKGVICVPTLEVTLPQSWESNAAYLVKEQDGKLAKMSDVTVTNDKESTTLVMTVTSLDGDCYVIGGVTEEQNKGADAANQSSKKKDGKEQSQEAQYESEFGTDSADADVSENAADENGENPAEENNDAGQDAGNDKKENGQKADAKDPGGDAADQEDTASASNTCTISISCATILDNMDNLKSSKAEFVPSDGWILAPTEVEFTEGESVHDVLQRVCKEAGIQMESSFTPAYNSAYVEGINNLYEFDCGELSGWMFSVNGWYPNYGCSKYTVNAGDEICWVYTCNLGKDVGDNSMY